jgi:hypothetical protein
MVGAFGGRGPNQVHSSDIPSMVIAVCMKWGGKEAEI